MLLKEDGHLDIERVKTLNKEELEKEMEDWDDEMLFVRNWICGYNALIFEDETKLINI